MTGARIRAVVCALACVRCAGWPGGAEDPSTAPRDYWPDRRDYAIGWTVAILLMSMLLSFAAQWWPAVEPLAVVSVLNYYFPAGVLTDGQWPTENNIVLLAVGLSCWCLGGVITARRSICTV